MPLQFFIEIDICCLLADFLFRRESSGHDEALVELIGNPTVESLTLTLEYNVYLQNHTNASDKKAYFLIA